MIFGKDNLSKQAPKQTLTLSLRGSTFDTAHFAQSGLDARTPVSRVSVRAFAKLAVPERVLWDQAVPNQVCRRTNKGSGPLLISPSL